MSDTPTPYKPGLISRSRGAKLLIVCYLAVLMSIPAGFVFLLLHDRSHRAEEVADEIEGIVLTHAHEDHIGAIGWLWERIGAPIYATPFTAFLVREKLREHGLLEQVELTEIPLGGRFQLGPFDIELVTLTHSVPEPSALAIRTPLGLVLHTGDWKIDPDPIVGAPTDPSVLIGQVLKGPREDVGENIVRGFLALWDSPEGQPRLLAILRSAMTHEAASRMLREFLTREVFGRVTREFSGDLDPADVELRAGLAAGQMAGVALMRYVVGVPAVVKASQEDLVRCLAPTMQRYLVG